RTSLSVNTPDRQPSLGPVMPKLPRSLSRWFARKPRTYRRPDASRRPQLGLLSLEDRITPTPFGFAGIGTLEQVKFFYGADGTRSVSDPPNAMGAIGPNHFVENLNGTFAIYRRNGTLAYKATGNDFFLHNFQDPLNPVEPEEKNGSFSVYDTRILFDKTS